MVRCISYRSWLGLAPLYFTVYNYVMSALNKLVTIVIMIIIIFIIFSMICMHNNNNGNIKPCSKPHLCFHHLVRRSLRKIEAAIFCIVCASQVIAGYFANIACSIC